MSLIETPNYRLFPSDSSKWVIIESKDGLKIDTEIRILGFRHTCRPHVIKRHGSSIMCSRLCCYGGCYVTPAEIQKISHILPKIKQDLPEDSLAVLNKYQDEFTDPEDHDEEENLYKIRCAPREWVYEDDPELKSCTPEEINKTMDEEFSFPPKNHCLFLMDNGYCAVHKYFLDQGEKWFQQGNKFQICTTFPLDIRPQDQTLAFMDEFEEFFFEKVSCISDDEELKKALRMPYITYDMKDILVDRFSLSFWNALDQVGKDWRAGKINIQDLYQNQS